MKRSLPSGVYASEDILKNLFLFVLGLSAAAHLQGAGHDYLALGDSVAFGYSPLVAPIESNYVGYPEIVGKQVHRVDLLASLACPGETSGSFLSPTAPDNNCRAFKGAFGLHTNYIGTQGDYAINLLQSERKIDLVTLSIGGNDLILLQLACANEPACILGGLPAVLERYATNLSVILGRIRLEARYSGQIVLLTYYSPDYRDPIQTGGIAALNGVATRVAPLFRAQVADGFAAFARASAPAGGDTCAAGLLITVAPGVCDVHPLAAGQNLLAATVRSQAKGN